MIYVDVNGGGSTAGTSTPPRPTAQSSRSSSPRSPPAANSAVAKTFTPPSCARSGRRSGSLSRRRSPQFRFLNVDTVGGRSIYTTRRSRTGQDEAFFHATSSTAPPSTSTVQKRPISPRSSPARARPGSAWPEGSRVRLRHSGTAGSAHHNDLMGANQPVNTRYLISDIDVGFLAATTRSTLDSPLDEPGYPTDLGKTLLTVFDPSAHALTIRADPRVTTTPSYWPHPARTCW